MSRNSVYGPRNYIAVRTQRKSPKVEEDIQQYVAFLEDELGTALKCDDLPRFQPAR